jgi:hypothetical protein
MSVASHPLLLRRVLQLDAAATGATALLAVAAAQPLGALFELPVELLRYAGIALIPFVALVLWAATRARIPTGAVRLIVGANLAWAAASLGLVLSGWIAPTTLGVVFVIAQATVVAVFAELQVIALRKAAPAAA